MSSSSTPRKRGRRPKSELVPEKGVLSSWVSSAPAKQLEDAGSIVEAESFINFDEPELAIQTADINSVIESKEDSPYIVEEESIPIASKKATKQVKRKSVPAGKNISCPFEHCNLTFISPIGLKKHHQRFIHNTIFSGAIVHKCLLLGCEQYFSSQDALNTHRKQHPSSQLKAHSTIIASQKENIGKIVSGEFSAEESAQVLTLQEAKSALSEDLHSTCQFLFFFDLIEHEDNGDETFSGIFAKFVQSLHRGGVLKVLSIEKSSTQFMCPIPNCCKVFSSTTAIKYHFLHFLHSLEDIFVGKLAVLNEIEGPIALYGLAILSLEEDEVLYLPIIFSKGNSVQKGKKSSSRISLPQFTIADPIDVDNEFMDWVKEQFFISNESSYPAMTIDVLERIIVNQDGNDLNISIEKRCSKSFSNSFILANIGGTVTCMAFIDPNRLIVAYDKNPMTRLKLDDFSASLEELQIWTFDSKTFSLSLTSSIFHQYGAPRCLKPIHPTRSTSPVIMALFNDGVIRIFSLSHESGHLINPIECDLHPHHNLTACDYYFKQDGLFIVGGTFDGCLAVWKMKVGEFHPQPIIFFSLCDSIIRSVVYCDSLSKLIVATQSSKLYQVDLESFDSRVILSARCTTLSNLLSFFLVPQVD